MKYIINCSERGCFNEVECENKPELCPTCGNPLHALDALPIVPLTPPPAPEPPPAPAPAPESTGAGEGESASTPAQ